MRATNGSAREEGKGGESAPLIHVAMEVAKALSDSRRILLLILGMDKLAPCLPFNFWRMIQGIHSILTRVWDQARVSRATELDLLSQGA